VRNCGVVTLSWEGGGEHALDLDNKYPDWGMQGEVFNFYYDKSSLTTYNGNMNKDISEVKSGKPSFDRCSDPTATHFVYTIEITNYDANSMFCARSPQGRYAAIRMIKDWSSPDYIDLAIVTWESKS